MIALALDTDQGISNNDSKTEIQRVRRSEKEPAAPAGAAAVTSFAAEMMIMMTRRGGWG